MQGLIPDFIDRCITQKQWGGFRWAVVLFADLQGFTRYTAEQASTHNQGAEALALMLNRVFRSASEAIHSEGGFIPYYAGDAFAGIFFGESAKESALLAALRLQAALHPLELTTPLRIGIGAGDIEWHISSGTPHRWLIRGEGIRQAVEVQQCTPPGEIGLHPSLVATPAQNVVPGLEGDIFLYRSAAPVAPHSRSPHPTRHAADCFPAFLHGRLAGAEFREVATLFLAFPQYAAPEELLRFLSQACIRIEQRKGYVKEIDVSDKGGLLVAFFGAPISEGAKTVNALYAASTLLEVAPAGWPLRVGVATGKAFCGLIGDDHRRQYVVAGPSVNLAARLAMQADSGQILSDGNVKDIAALLTVDKGLHRFKGFDQPISVIEVLGFQNSREQDKPMYPRAAFSKGWRRVFDGTEPFVRVITGEAGLGKSFIAKTLVRQTGHHWHWLTVEGDPFLSGVFAPLQKAWAPHITADSTPTEWIQLLEVTANHDLPARERFERMQQLHRQLLQKPFNGKPVAVLLEQVPYLDSGTLGLLLDGQPPAASLLITCRDIGELNHSVAPEDVQVLPSLDREGMVFLTSHLLGGAANDRLLTFLLQTSQGNPFHAEQLLLYLQKRVRLTKAEDGSFDVEEEAIRSGGALRDILTERLDALPAGVRSLLKWAALLGRQFQQQVLYPLLQDDQHGTAPEEDLQLAIQEDFIVEERPGIWTFRHRLLRETLLDLQLPSWLQAGHRSIVRVMEIHLAGDLENHYPELALHCMEGQLPDQARAYYRKAAGVAIRFYQNQEAVRYLEQALQLAETPMEAAGIRLELTVPMIQLGRWQDVLDVLASTVFEEVENPDTEASHQLALGQVRLLRGEYDPAKSHLQQALTHYQDIQDTHGMRNAMRELSILYFRTGDYPRAEAAIEETQALMGEARDYALTMNLALIRMNQGRYREGEELLMDELSYRLQTGEMQPIVPLWVNLGVVRNEMGAWERAREAIDRGYAQAVASGNRLWESIALGTRGLIAYNQGRWEDAESDFEADLVLARELGDRQGVAIALELRGTLLADRGEGATARPVLEHSLQQCRLIGYKKGQVKCLLALAKCELAENRHESASKLLDEGLHLAREMGNRKLMVLTRMTMAEIDVGPQSVEAIQHWEAVAEDVIEWEDAVLRGRWHRLALRLLEGADLDAALKAAGDLMEDPWTRAEVFFKKWQLRAKPEDREEALKLYREHYARTPHFEVKQRMELIA